MIATDTLDRTFDALANEHRRRIVTELRIGDLGSPELGERFTMSKQALHRHVQVLEAAGLVERRREGRTHRLTLVQDPLTTVTTWVSEVQTGWTASLDRLADVIAEDPNE